MTQKLTILAIASAFALTSGVAFAEGPNDGPKYPSMESHKQFQAYRNQDHNNPSPRYATTTKQTATPTAGAGSPRYTVRSTQRRVTSGNHG